MVLSRELSSGHLIPECLDQGQGTAGLSQMTVLLWVGNARIPSSKVVLELYEVVVLYTLNLHWAVCPLYLNRRKKNHMKLRRVLDC